MTAEEVTVVHVAEREESAESSSKVDTVVEENNEKKEMEKEDLSNGANGMAVKEETDVETDYVMVEGSDGVNGNPPESDLEKNGNGIAGEDPRVEKLEIKGEVKSESQDKEPIELCPVESPPLITGDLVDSDTVSGGIDVGDGVSETSRPDQNGFSEPPEAVSDSNGDASANVIAERTVSEDAAVDSSAKQGAVLDNNGDGDNLANGSVEDSVLDTRLKENGNSEIAGDGLTNKDTNSNSEGADGTNSNSEGADGCHGVSDPVPLVSDSNGAKADTKGGDSLGADTNGGDSLEAAVVDSGGADTTDSSGADTNGGDSLEAAVVDTNGGDSSEAAALDSSAKSDEVSSISLNNCSVEDRVGDTKLEENDSEIAVVEEDTQCVVGLGHEEDGVAPVSAAVGDSEKNDVSVSVISEAQMGIQPSDGNGDCPVSDAPKAADVDTLQVGDTEDKSTASVETDDTKTPTVKDKENSENSEKLELGDVIVEETQSEDAIVETSIEKEEDAIVETSIEKEEDPEVSIMNETDSGGSDGNTVDTETLSGTVDSEISDTGGTGLKSEVLDPKVEDSVQELELKIGVKIGVADSIPSDKAEISTSLAEFKCEVDVVADSIPSDKSDISTGREVDVASSSPVSKDIPIKDDSEHETHIANEKISDGAIQFGSLEAESVNEVEAESVNEVEAESVNEVEKKKPFYYLIRVPRYDDEDLKEKIRLAQIRVNEKTQIRDAVCSERQSMKATCKEYAEKFDAAKAQERVARDLLRSKRQEIESIQSVINIEDIGGRIRNLEHRIQHETLQLKEEKQLIREIKQLKQDREQLSSNMGKQDEVQQGLDEKDQTEKRLKSLKKEADQLRDNLQKAEAVTKAAKKKYHDENEKLKALAKQFRDADEIRQEAFAQLQGLKKQSYEKGKSFWQFKDDSKTAHELALKRDKEALQNLCVTQVERVMELWNNNDEFRKDYVRFNVRSTLKRLRTLDGRALGPNEQPFIPQVVNERVAKDQTVSSSTLEEQKQEKLVLPKAEKPNNKPMAKAAEQKNQISKSEKPVKSVPPAHGSTTASTSDEIEREEKPKMTKEEEEAARRAEVLRKEEEAARLREQHRLDEIAKAKEAIERKKRIAEKAQARAVFRAQKEAEQKEKEREKKARKKERRKVAAGGTVGDAIVTDEVEPAPTPEIPAETTETEIKEKPVTVAKRAQKPQFTKQSKAKSIPPPLRNRGKRKMQPWMWVLLTTLVIFVLFLVGNSNILFNLGSFST